MLGLPCPRPRPLVLLLLAAGELSQLLEHLVDRLVPALALAAPDLLVLIAQLVPLLLEELGQFVADVAAAAALPALGELHVGEGRLRPLQQLQRFLLRDQRLVGAAPAQSLLGDRHLPGRPRQQLDHGGDRRIAARSAAHRRALRESRDQGFDLLA